MFEGSVLLEIAQKTKISEVYEASISTQILWFKKTIAKLEHYLDTGDLTQLTPASLSIIKADLLNMINGFRMIASTKTAEIYDLVTSLDKILENLRTARDIIFVCEKMFDGDELKDEKNEVFFAKLRESRKHIADALETFK